MKKCTFRKNRHLFSDWHLKMILQRDSLVFMPLKPPISCREIRADLAGSCSRLILLEFTFDGNKQF